jgi:hypothetical protein
LNDDSVFLPHTPNSTKLLDEYSKSSINKYNNSNNNQLSKSNVLTTQYPSKNNNNIKYTDIESLGKKSQYSLNNNLTSNSSSLITTQKPINSGLLIKKTDNDNNNNWVQRNDSNDILEDKPLSLKINVKTNPNYSKTLPSNMNKITISEKKNEDGTGYTKTINKISISKNDDEYIEKYEHRHDEFEEKVINSSNIDNDSFNDISIINNNDNGSIQESTVTKHLKTFERNVIVSVAVRYHI